MSYSTNNGTIVMSAGGQMVTVSNVGNATHLGIALHAGSVYFLHTTGNVTSWLKDGSLPRPVWLNGTSDTAQISTTSNTAGTRQVGYSNFNIKAISVTDVP